MAGRAEARLRRPAAGGAGDDQAIMAHNHDGARSDSSTRVDLPDRADAPMRVRVTRGPMVESVHRVRAVAVGADGHVLGAWGDRQALTYPRSANKVMQALPLVETGAADAFGLGPAELALACASHSGEPAHTEKVAAWLDRIGLPVTALECGGHAPYHTPTWEAMLRRGEECCPLHNNCSGKHCGMLTTALHKGEKLSGYVGYTHPVQQRILGVMEQLCGQDLSRAPWGTDGCSIPTIALPLEALAYGMARLADPQDLPAVRAEAATRLLAAWGAHPHLVGGTGTFDTGFMQALSSRVLVKSGAEGVCCAIIPDAGIAAAVKVEDGTGRAAGPALAALLLKLDLISEAEWQAVADLAQPSLRNRAGIKVGAVEPGF